MLTFNITKGEGEGVDVGGLNVAMVADTPAVMTDGNRRVGLFMDAAGSPRRRKHSAEYSADRRAASSLAPLIGDFVEMEVEDFVSPLDGTGKGVHVTGVGFPADTLAAGTAKKSTFNAFGMKWDNSGKNSGSAPFAWSA